MRGNRVFLIAVIGIMATSVVGTSGLQVSSTHLKSYPLYSVSVTSAGEVKTVVGTCTENATLSQEAGIPVAICSLNPGATEGAVFQTNGSVAVAGGGAIAGVASFQSNGNTTGDIATLGDPTYTTYTGQNSACPGGSGWYAVVINFPSAYTTQTTSVVYGGYFDYSDSGHLENPTNYGTVSGITLSGFHYRTNLSTSGCWGLSWTSVGY